MGGNASLDAALAYVSRGWAVYPLVRGGKTPPAGTHGTKDATTDPATIGGWCQVHPEWGIGIACGKASNGMVVIDLDTIRGHGGKIDGADALAEWASGKGVRLPDTVVGLSPSGGRHLLYQADGHTPTRLHVLPNVDILGDGHGVVVPPSTGEGGGYTWEEGHSPEEIEVAQLPPELAELMAGHGTSSVHESKPGVPSPTGEISEGVRNDTLFQLACRLRDRGLSDDEVLESASEANRNRCKPPLDDSEVAGIVKSALSRPGRKRTGKPTVSELCDYIRADQALRGFGFDEPSYVTCVTGTLPWDKSARVREWNDEDDASCYAYLQERYGAGSRTDVRDAILIVSKGRSFSSVRDMLNGLPEWDGIHRAAHLLTVFLGADDDEYTNMAWLLFMRGAVARAFMPGCQFDYVLVLVGRQGIGKSTFLRLMAMHDELFTDSLTNLEREKDSAEIIRGKWIGELPELSAMRGKEIEPVKSFISRQRDDYRESYGHRSSGKPRTCVLAGTTNRHDIIADTTGGRRFLPVQCGLTAPMEDLWGEKAKQVIVQAWAEIMYEWNEHQAGRGDFPLTLPKELIAKTEEVQADFTEDDPRIGQIQDYLDKLRADGITRVCSKQVAVEALGLGDDDCRNNKALFGDISTIIDYRCPGWKRHEKKGNVPGYGSQRFWEWTGLAPEGNAA